MQRVQSRTFGPWSGCQECGVRTCTNCMLPGSSIVISFPVPTLPLAYHLPGLNKSDAELESESAILGTLHKTCRTLDHYPGAGWCGLRTPQDPPSLHTPHYARTRTPGEAFFAFVRSKAPDLEMAMLFGPVRAPASESHQHKISAE